MQAAVTDNDKQTETPRRKIDWFWMLALIALVLQTGLLFIALFAPGLKYLVSNPRGESLESDQFYDTLSLLTTAYATDNNTIQVLANGENYYAAEIEAVRKAKSSINLEAYIFSTGKVTDQFVDAMSEKARAGVEVRVVADAVGSGSLSTETIDKLRRSGAKFSWYMPLKWYTWPRLNNRTHREILVIDGLVAFVGGSGWADHWLYADGKDKARWRDTMVRVEGPAVSGLQAAFSENWLESTGEVLYDRKFWPFRKTSDSGNSRALVVRSSPTTGRSTSARVLFQTLLASARRKILIATPYFLPDESVRDEVVRAIKERGVDVRIITPGPGTDHMLTRRSSRRLFGPLLEAGAHIYEYQPSMIHAKVLLIDSTWAVVGTTNMDPRSFSLNDEVNLATPDAAVTQQLELQFFDDLKQSREVSLEEWKNRGVAERAHEWFGGLIERQQ
jgi:cardiolipin synthase